MTHDNMREDNMTYGTTLHDTGLYDLQYNMTHDTRQDESGQYDLQDTRHNDDTEQHDTRQMI